MEDELLGSQEAREEAIEYVRFLREEVERFGVLGEGERYRRSMVPMRGQADWVGAFERGCDEGMSAGVIWMLIWLRP